MRRFTIKNNRFIASPKWFALLSVAFLFGAWLLLSNTVFKDNGVIPTPSKAFRKLFALLGTAKFYGAAGATLIKALIGFLAAYILGAALGAGAARSVRVKHFIEPIVTMLRSAPTLGVTFILFMWLKSGTAAVVIGMLVVFPVVYSAVSSALLAFDKNLTEMAAVYKVSPRRKLFGIYLPGITPALKSAALSGFGLNLKVVIAAEIIGLPKNSLGALIQTANSAYDFTALFTYVLIVVIISRLCEQLIKLLFAFVTPWEYGRGSFFRRIWQGRAKR